MKPILSDEEISQAAYQRNKTYAKEVGIFAYTRKPDADRSIADFAQRKTLERVIKDLSMISDQSPDVKYFELRVLEYIQSLQEDVEK